MCCFSTVLKPNSNLPRLLRFVSMLPVWICRCAEAQRLGVETLLPLESFNHLTCRRPLLRRLEKTGRGGIIAPNLVGVLPWAAERIPVVPDPVSTGVGNYQAEGCGRRVPFELPCLVRNGWFLLCFTLRPGSVCRAFLCAFDTRLGGVVFHNIEETI